MVYGFSTDCICQANFFYENTNTDVQFNCIRGIISGNSFFRLSTSSSQICINLRNTAETVIGENVFESNGSNVYAISVTDYELINSVPTWLAVSSQCAIRGNVFNNPYVGINFPGYTSGSGLNQGYKQFSIQGNLCTSATKAFVYVDNAAASPTVNSIGDLDISTNEVLPIASDAYGIYVLAVSSASIVGLRIYNNTFGSAASPGGTAVYADVLTGLYFVGNDCQECTTALSFAGSASASLAINNPGYNPKGYVSSAAPGSGAAYTNPYPYPVNVYIRGGTVSAIAISGTTVASTSNIVIQLGASGTSADSLTITYSVAPTFEWFGL
jgi:hypothetical protein